MQKWEYITKSVGRGYKGGLAGGQATAWKGDINLEAMGQDGWELVAVVPVSSFHDQNDNGFTTDLYYYFKRPKP